MITYQEMTQKCEDMRTRALLNFLKEKGIVIDLPIQSSSDLWDINEALLHLGYRIESDFISKETDTVKYTLYKIKQIASISIDVSIEPKVSYK